MLTSEEISEIDACVWHREKPAAASIDALNIVQSRRGWVSDEALQDIAAQLRMTTAELDDVATFYNHIFRRPVGRHVILLCDSVSCWITGYETLRSHLETHLGIRPGETTPDGRFTLVPNCCLGVCERAPALMIDRELHTDLTPEALGGLLDRYP